MTPIKDILSKSIKNLIPNSIVHFNGLEGHQDQTIDIGVDELPDAELEKQIRSLIEKSGIAFTEVVFSEKK